MALNLPDVNVLVYAFRVDSIHHERCKSWLERLGGGDAPFGISPRALSAVVRIVTNGRVHREPSEMGETLAFCEKLLDRPNCTRMEPGERHWPIFARLLRETETRGPDVSDAWYAALAIEHGCTFITFDREYARFPGLDWREPG